MVSETNRREARYDQPHSNYQTHFIRQPDHQSGHQPAAQRKALPLSHSLGELPSIPQENARDAGSPEPLQKGEGLDNIMAHIYMSFKPFLQDNPPAFNMETYSVENLKWALDSFIAIHVQSLKELEIQDKKYDKIHQLKDKMERENQRKIGYLAGKLSISEEQNKARQQKHDDRVRLIGSIHESEKNKLIHGHNLALSHLKQEKEHQQEAYDVYISQLREEHGKQLASKQAEFIQELDTGEAGAKDEKEKMRQDFAKEKASIERGDHNAKEELEIRLETSNRQLKREQDAKSTLGSEHEAEKKKMRQVHEIEKETLVRKLREDVAALQGALVKRDHFKAMSDHELALRFQDITTEVDEFA